ncbi:MAG TPA: protein YgfX [Burkholderiales bacterium]
MSAAPTLRFDLKPSIRLAGVLLLAHVLALAALWVSLAGWARYLAACGILLSAAACLAAALHRSSRTAVSLELHADGRASWRDRSGGWHEGRLAGDHFVSAALVVLGLVQPEGDRKSLVLMADSASPEDFRRLRVWLRWRADPGPGGRAGPSE